MKHNLYIYIFVMAAVTYLIRMLPLTLIQKEIKNDFVKSFLYYVPYVTLTATANIWSAAIGFAIALILAWNRKSLICVSLFSCTGVFLVELLTGL